MGNTAVDYIPHLLQYLTNSLLFEFFIVFPYIMQCRLKNPFFYMHSKYIFFKLT